MCWETGHMYHRQQPSIPPVAPLLERDSTTVTNEQPTNQNERETKKNAGVAVVQGKRLSLEQRRLRRRGVRRPPGRDAMVQDQRV